MPRMPKIQYRYSDGAIFRRDDKPYSYDLRIHDLGHGQVEAVATPRYAWTEIDATTEALSMAAEAQDRIWDHGNGDWVDHTPTAAELERRAQDNRERSARRARTAVRRLIKHKNLNTMLTLTYKENVQDRSRMARDFDVFMKRVRRVLPGFEYVCVFEQQKRGAWHAHMAVQKLQSHYYVKGVLVKSYDLLRAIWRRVVGEGNVDVSRSKNHRQRSVAKLASYLSKYLSKTFESGSQGGDSYRASGKALPRPMVFRSNSTDVLSAASDLLGLLRSELLAALGAGKSVPGCFLDGGGYYFALSP